MRIRSRQIQDWSMKEAEIRCFHENRVNVLDHALKPGWHALFWVTAWAERSLEKMDAADSYCEVDA
jgi:hypothetical protein